MDRKKFSKGLENVIIDTTSISFITSDEKLLYRGYSIVDLDERASFEEVIYLLIDERLPNEKELEKLKTLLIKEAKLPKQLIEVLKQIPSTASPMDVLRTSVSFLGSLSENRKYSIEEIKIIAYSLVAKLPLALMTWFYLSKNQPVPSITEKLSYAGRFLQLVTNTEPNIFEEKIINTSLILYAEHEFNASTFCARVTASTLSDIYSAITSGIGALKGPLHGGANEAVLKLVLKFQDPDDAEKGVINMLNQKEKIMGFGHRVYKNGDERSFIMKKIAKRLSEEKGNQKHFEIAERIEKVMKEKKGLFPNLDFYSAITYFLLGIPIILYTPMFVLSRTSGWSAHVIEQLSNNRLIRPRAIYNGPPRREFIPIEKRNPA